MQSTLSDTADPAHWSANHSRGTRHAARGTRHAARGTRHPAALASRHVLHHADASAGSVMPSDPLAGRHGTDCRAGCAGIAAVAALILTLTLSGALGWPGGGAALVIVLCGWLYNLGLKATALSWLPYAIAFGMLPAAATLSASQPRWPATWALTAGALLGVAAHLANVLPDLGEDAATGIRGLPHRLGAKTTALAGAGILLAC